MILKHPSSKTERSIKQRGVLRVVATPIGNLNDLSRRAWAAINDAAVLVCEDTRVTAKLISASHMSPGRIISYHHHSPDSRIAEIMAELTAGKTVAVVTDAGSPGVADPGGKLVSAAYELGAKVEVVPGPSALTAALSISGLPADHFRFLGFLPHKKGRETRLREVVAAGETTVFFESPHRIVKTLTWLNDKLDQSRIVVLAREMTKIFEEVIRGSAAEVYQAIINNPQKVRGEFVIMVSGRID